MSSVGDAPRAVVLVAVVVVGGLVFVDLCAWIFGCGCRSLWAGAAAACNVHHASGPRCPWCAHPWAGGAVAWLAVTVAQAATVLVPRTASTATRFIGGLAALPLVGGSIGWLQGWWWGYWA